MGHSRRTFIRNSAFASASLFVPQFLRASSGFLSPDGKPKVLVVIQFAGGNDGLNCIVPFRDDLYHKARPNIGYQKAELIALSDDIGMNANLQGLADLFFRGDVVIVNGVGYPNPNRSHFRSMDIWQSASDENIYWQTGWLGRYLDASCNTGNCSKPHKAVEIDDSLSLALKGEKVSGFATRDPKLLKSTAQDPFIEAIAHENASFHDHEHNVEYLHKLLVDTAESTEYIYEKSTIYTSGALYPDTQFAQQLKTVAELIVAESNTMVYYVSLSGFDTHAAQRNQQEKQLKVYADAVKVFCDDLKANNKFNDTLIMTFSEFGRRVEENASKGTDHGTASNIYLIGGGLKRGGMINDMPDLANLDEGDLIHQVDFRSVYSTILDKWLYADPKAILGRDFPLLDFLT
ncbi:MAG: DUF1501 domain-containing protein [Chitinophagales bacterium]